MSNDEHRKQARNNNPLGKTVYDSDDTPPQRTTSEIFEQMMTSKTTALDLTSHELRTGPFIWTPIGLKVDGTITRDAWEATGKILNKISQSIQWLIGDWMLAAEELGYGDREEIAAELGFKLTSIYQYAYVARKVEFSIRIEILDFGHHQVVAPMTPEKQAFWLKKAAQGADGKPWTIARLRKEIDTAEGHLPDPTPAWYKPIETLRERYHPDKWQRLTTEQRHQIYTELKAILDRMEEQLI